MFSKLEMTLIGNVGGDPEVREFDGGNKVLNFRVAANVRKGKGDEAENQTCWVNCALWGENRIAAFQRWMQKGTKVYVQGTPLFDPETGSPRTYDKDGETRTKFELSVREMVLLGNTRDASDDDGSDSDGDLPF